MGPKEEFGALGVSAIGDRTTLRAHCNRLSMNGNGTQPPKLVKLAVWGDRRAGCASHPAHANAHRNSGGSCSNTTDPRCKPLDCLWSDWSDWSACDQSCGAAGVVPTNKTTDPGRHIIVCLAAKRAVSHCTASGAIGRIGARVTSHAERRV